MCKQKYYIYTLCIFERRERGHQTWKDIFQGITVQHGLKLRQKNVAGKEKGRRKLNAIFCSEGKRKVMVN